MNSTLISRLAGLVLFSILIFSSCEKDLPVQKAIHIAEWSVEDYTPFDWNARFQKLSKNSSLKSGNADQPFKSPNPSELSKMHDFISGSEHASVIDKITEEIGTPEWDMTTKIKHHGNEYMLYAPLMTDEGEVNGLFQYHSDKSTNRQSFRAVRESSIEALVENNDAPLLGLVDVIGFLNTSGVATEKVEEPINDWIIKQKPEDIKSDDSKSFATVITVWYYHATGITYSLGSYDVTVWNPCSDENTGGGITNPFENDIDETITGGGVVIPTIELEEIITDNTTTQCVKNMINKIKNNQFGPNLFVQVLRDVFDKNSDVNITIEEVSLSQSLDAQFTGTWNGATGVALFNGTISINSNHTSTATEDWILGTIIHEMIHGYIAYQRSRIGAGEITQAEFDREFPLYSSGDPQSEHLTMGYQYVDKIADILQENNSNLTREEALSLSRVGLQDTGFWAFQLTNTDKANATAANNSGRTSTGTTSQKNC